MILTMLKACRGDSFILEWGVKNQFSLLLDGGFPSTYNNEISNLIPKLKNLKAVIVSHIDYDHIFGIIKLIADENITKDFTLYLNTPELIVNKNKESQVGYEHGELLIELINEKEIKHKALCSSVTKNLVIDGLDCTILTPSLEVLEQLKEKWDAYRIEEAEEFENKTSDLVSSDPVKLKNVKEVLNEKETAKKWNSDLVNSSSITFIAEYDGKKVLFLADGNPDLIEESLRELGYSTESPLEVEAIKLSHHGSKHNTTKSLLEILKTDKVIISTNQRGNSRHPHRETIIKVGKYLQRPKNKLELFFNYQINFEEFITIEERKLFNLKFTVAKFIKI